MTRDLESQLRFWARPPGDDEQRRMDNAESMVRDAIARDPKLNGRDVRVFAQGSYKNLTYIPGESDVDICVVYRDAWYSDWDQVDPAAKTDPVVLARLMAEANIVEVQYRHAEFRDDVGAGLVARFGPAASCRSAATRCSTSARPPTTSTPTCWRPWSTDATTGRRHLVPRGVSSSTARARRSSTGPSSRTPTGSARTRPDRRALQGHGPGAQEPPHRDGRRGGVAAAGPIPSFLIECLVWNVPDSCFGNPTYTQDVKDVLFYLWSNSKADDAPCHDWAEENDLFYLLRGGRGPWTRAQVHAFLRAAWGHLDLPDGKGSLMTSRAEWEAKLMRWSVGPGKTEEEKMDHAVAAIHAAIGKSTVLAPHDIEVLGTGSFKNRTHIPTESDVDVAVIYKDVFDSDWSLVDPRASTDHTVVEALMREAKVQNSLYLYPEYKDDVEAALVAHFGRASVKRGDKAFDIRENTYRVESDCVAMFERRRWRRDATTGALVFTRGTWFVSDSGTEIINYQKQQFANGSAKHDRTGRHYKKMVRIMKNLCNEMNDVGNPAAKPMSSFLIECLVYRVPDNFFTGATFYDRLKVALAWMLTNTATDVMCGDWLEENDIKFLFRSSQPWTRSDANAFLNAAWRHWKASHEADVEPDLGHRRGRLGRLVRPGGPPSDHRGHDLGCP